METLNDEKMTKFAGQLLRLTAAFLLVVLVPVTKSDASEGGFVPSVAGTLTLPPLLGDATEISGRLFYAMHGRNDATRYQAGDMVILDWALSERIGRFQVGAVGSFARQVEADRIADQPGPTTSVTAFGGVVAMDLPEFGAFLSLKAQRDVEASWRLRRDAIGLRIGVRL